MTTRPGEMANAPRHRAPSLLLMAAVCLAILGGERVAINLFHPETLPVGWALERIALGTFLDAAPLFLLILLHLLRGRGVLVPLLAAGYFLVVTLWNLTNACLLLTARRVVDFTLLREVLPEWQFAFAALNPRAGILTFCGVAVCGMAAWLLFRALRAFPAASERGTRRRAFAFFGMLSLLCVAATGYYGLTEYDMERRRGWRIAPVWRHVWTLGLETVRTQGARPAVTPEFSPADRERLGAAGLWRGSPDGGAAGPIRNVIIICIESLDRDLIHAYNPAIPSEATPALDALVRESVSFPSYFTSAMPTANGLHATLASRLFFHDDRGFVPNLFSVLQEHGYAGYYLNAVTDVWGQQADLGGNGFKRRYRPQHMLYREYFEDKFGAESEKWGLQSSYLFREVLEILRATPDEKHFFVISTIETHPPYNTPSADRASCAGIPALGNNPALVALCAQDRALGRFVEQLRPYMKESLLIITADHSSAFGAEHTGKKDFGPARIPLLFLTDMPLPGFGPRGTRIERYGSQIDLAVTILDLLGLPVPGTMMGRDLRAQEAAYSVDGDRGVRRRNAAGERDVAFGDGDALARWLELFYPQKALPPE